MRDNESIKEKLKIHNDDKGIKESKGRQENETRIIEGREVKEFE